MTDEEMALSWIAKYVGQTVEVIKSVQLKVYRNLKDAFLAGHKASRPKWHKVDDRDLPKGDEGFGKNSIHRKIYLKDRYGNLYTGNYYPKDESHPEDCFAVEFLDWGLQGSQFCAKEQISEWCEIPEYTED